MDTLLWVLLGVAALVLAMWLMMRIGQGILWLVRVVFGVGAGTSVAFRQAIRDLER
ncbi:MAG: hypothetical protein WAK55_17515 [Xanthobacteraceae bacterium]